MCQTYDKMSFGNTYIVIHLVKLVIRSVLIPLCLQIISFYGLGSLIVLKNTLRITLTFSCGLCRAICDLDKTEMGPGFPAKRTFLQTFPKYLLEIKNLFNLLCASLEALLNIFSGGSKRWGSFFIFIQFSAIKCQKIG